MKKFFIVTAIVLSSGIAAVSFSRNTEVKNPEIKLEQTRFTSKAMQGYGGFKSNIANAD